jgi:hypothetical protein
MCLLGQSCVFEEGEEMLEQMLGISISAKQIQRVSEYYGEQLETQEQSPAPALTKKEVDNPLYMMLDGGMVYTREEGWKEMKVGRMFYADDIVAIQENRREVIHSLYVCHLGDHKEFFNKMEHYLQGYCGQKICVADGAKWIWNWVDDHCSNTIQILDYYHAVEKIATYARCRYPDEEERKQWMTVQKQHLLNNEVSAIIENLKADKKGSKEAAKLREEAIRYYENNQSRMQYKTYLEKGYIIGSGAIESANRNVVQQRLKLSGQRWTIRGAQQIVNLRAYKLSNRWSEVTAVIKKAA